MSLQHKLNGSRREKSASCKVSLSVILLITSKESGTLGDHLQKYSQNHFQGRIKIGAEKNLFKKLDNMHSNESEGKKFGNGKWTE